MGRMYIWCTGDDIYSRDYPSLKKVGETLKRNSSSCTTRWVSFFNKVGETLQNETHPVAQLDEFRFWMMFRLWTSGLWCFGLVRCGTLKKFRCRGRELGLTPARGSLQSHFATTSDLAGQKGGAWRNVPTCVINFVVVVSWMDQLVQSCSIRKNISVWDVKEMKDVSWMDQLLRFWAACVFGWIMLSVESFCCFPPPFSRWYGQIRSPTWGGSRWIQG